MAGISLGSFNTTGGKTTGLGLISGLDSSTIIDGILSAQADSIKSVTDKIGVNKTKISEVNNLKTLLDRLRTTAGFLRSPPGVDNENNDFFKHTTSSLTSNTTIAASNYLSVSTQAGASLNSYSIANITRAVANQIRRDGFTSQTSSVVGNLSVIDNHQVVSDFAVVGNVLNSTAPITFANDIQGVKASIDVTFGSQNQFGATDTLTFGATTLTFGGTVGNDISLSGAATVAEKVAAIATHMNTISTGEESKYTYTASGSVLTVTRDTDGSNSQVKTDLAISADFSIHGETTQTVKIGSAGALNVAPGGALNSFGTDGNQGTAATQAYLELSFGSENEFDSDDQIIFGSTTITFGGTGGNDIDISSATTLDQKLDAIVARMNAVATAPENTYTYTRSSTGVITITQDTAGDIATVGNDMTVETDFSNGDDTTQTVAIGKNYKNNGSVEGSVARSNGTVSGSVSQNGIDGHYGATKATINVQMLVNNATIAATDSITFGNTTISFGGGVNNVAIGADLPATLVNIANYLNALTTVPESRYTYTSDGIDKIIVTRDTYGTNSTNLAISANFSVGDVTNTVKIGSAAALNIAPGGALNALGTEGIDQISISDAYTTPISTLSGAITISSATYLAGTSSAISFTPNTVEFKATIGGVSYTSRPVTLDNGQINGAGSTLGNTLPSGTTITFVKDTDGDTTPSTKDVTFQLVVGDATTINDAAGATAYASSINTWLNTTNTINITQNPTVPPLRAGTFNLGGVDITLDEGDNLQVIKSKINAVSDTSGVHAEIVQVSSNNFSLVLKSTETGVVNKIFEFSDGDVGDGLTGTIQIGNDSIAFTQVSAGSDASFTLDGQVITRASNTIDDVIDKVTFSFLSDTPDDVPPTLTLEITSDTSIIKSGVTDFLNAYNELKFYVAEQTQRDSNNKLVEGAVLGDETILRELMDSLNDELSRTITGLFGTNNLFEVGIDTIDFPGDAETPATKNIFILDEAKFDAALAANFNDFKNVFIFNFQANSPDLGVFAHTKNLELNNFILDIDVSRAIGDQVRVLDSTTHEILFYADLSGSRISGQTGTALSGLILVYTGDGDDTITVSATSGIADSIFNLTENYVKANGLIDAKVQSITDDNKTLQTRIDRDTAVMNAQRQVLVSQFTQLEAIISSANDTLSFIDSQRASDSSSN